MTEQTDRGKPKYESPVLIPLGEMAKGSGQCEAGSAVELPCDCGGAPAGGITDCEPGYTATQDCTEGPTAGRDCSAGTCALRACTAGVSAEIGCTAGGAIG